MQQAAGERGRLFSGKAVDSGGCFFRIAGLQNPVFMIHWSRIRGNYGISFTGWGENMKSEDIPFFLKKIGFDGTRRCGGLSKRMGTI